METWGSHSNLSPSWLCDPGKSIALSVLGGPLENNRIKSPRGLLSG